VTFMYVGMLSVSCDFHWNRQSVCIFTDGLGSFSVYFPYTLSNLLRGVITDGWLGTIVHALNTPSAITGTVVDGLQLLYVVTKCSD
jgi:hypothetical protein